MNRLIYEVAPTSTEVAPSPEIQYLAGQDTSFTSASDGPTNHL
jgi:hypothetical protein